MKKCGTYHIKGPTGKRYIGSAVDIAQRWRTHRCLLRRGDHHAPYLQNAWNKYGEEAFEFLVLEEHLVDRILEAEQILLDKYKTWNPKNGYNTLKIAGSTLGYKHTEETKAKISESIKGIERSEETKEKFRQRMLGYNPSEETREKLRQANLGKKKSEESKKKLSNSLKKAYAEGRKMPWNLGKSASEESKRKASKALKGKPKSEEHKAKLRKPKKSKRSPETIAKWRESMAKRKDNEC